MRRGENIYKRKDGRWEGRYQKGRKLDGTIYYGYIYDYSYLSLKNKLLEKKRQSQLVTNVSYSGTFSQWCDHWLSTLMQPKIKPSTFASYQNKLTSYVFPYIGKKRLTTITSSDVTTTLKKLEERLSPSSIRVVFQLIKNCFNAAIEAQKLEQNPCQSVTLPKVKKPVSRALTLTEQKNLKKQAVKNGSIFRSFFLYKQGCD